MIGYFDPIINTIVVMRSQKEENILRKADCCSRGQPSFNGDPFTAKTLTKEVCLHINLNCEHDSYTP